MYPAHHYTAQHAKPRSPALVKALTVIGALMVIVTLGFAGYAVGTTVTHQQVQVTQHVKVIPVPMPTHVTPAPPHHAVPHPSASALHAHHVWHLLHVAHMAHLAWLKAHGVLTE